MNFFKKKEIVRLDDTKEYKDIAISIRNKFPDNPLKQLEEWEKQPSEYRVMGISEVVQHFLAHQQGKSANLGAGQIELLYRSLLDLSRHLQENLPDGVYDYNYYNIQGVSKYLLKDISGEE